MKPFHLIIAGLFALCTLANASASSASPSELLVDSDWLAQHLHDPNLVLLHVGEADAYAQGHIAGARLVSLDDISVSEHTRTGLMLQMPTAADLRERLQKLGISNDSRIIVYYGQDWLSPSTRVVLTLQYAGLGGQTSLLDGGMAAWQRAGQPISQDRPPARIGKLTPLSIQNLVVDADHVRRQLNAPGVAIVDGRAAAYYDGVAIGGAHGHIHRSGHIRGARSIPFTEITDDHLQLRSPAELRALFTRAGVRPGDTVIGYCHIGQQATAMLFAAQLLGHPVRLYDGSFQDWSRGSDHPVEASATAASP